MTKDVHKTQRSGPRPSGVFEGNVPRECRSIPQISFWGMLFPQMLKCTKLFPLWLHTRPSWGSLQCFPRLPSWIYGSLLLGKEGEKERERRAKEGERLEERRGGEVKRTSEHSPTSKSAITPLPETKMRQRHLPVCPK